MLIKLSSTQRISTFF